MHCADGITKILSLHSDHRPINRKKKDMFKGLGKSLGKIFGTKYDRDVKGYMPVVEEANEIFETLSPLSNDELRNKTLEFRSKIAEHLSAPMLPARPWPDVLPPPLPLPAIFVALEFEFEPA